MTPDRLDVTAREAAADLHAEVADIDTEAALAALHRSADGKPTWIHRLPSCRSLVAAAAVVVAVAGVAFAMSSSGGDDSERVGVGSETIDPASYGSLLGTLDGLDDPGLRAEFYGPVALDDRDEIAVSITGGIPGQEYAISQCAHGDPNYNPAANCGPSRPLVLGSDGTGVVVVEAWTVFDGVGALFRNDCREVSCELQLTPVVQEDEPDEGLPGTSFAELQYPPQIPSPWILLKFLPGAGAPPLPEITATYLDRDDQGRRVRVEGSGLVPGPAQVLAFGRQSPPTGMMTNLPGMGPAEVADVEVAADGTLSAIVTLPDAITDTSVSEINGVEQDPEVVACDGSPGYCEIRVIGAVAPPTVGGRPALSALPVRYPEGP